MTLFSPHDWNFSENLLQKLINYYNGWFFLEFFLGGKVILYKIIWNPKYIYTYGI